MHSRDHAVQTLRPSGTQARRVPCPAELSPCPPNGGGRRLQYHAKYQLCGPVSLRVGADVLQAATLFLLVDDLPTLDAWLRPFGSLSPIKRNDSISA